MNLIDFTKDGGYRFKQFTLRKMQEAYFQLLKAFVQLCNVPEAGNYIISGCQIVGPNITAGYLYIDGELCKFDQAAGTAASKIKKNVVIQSLGFKNGNNENVFRFVHAAIDAAGTELSAFIRVSPVFDGNYVHTDNNFTNAQSIKLAGIESGAEVNVQSDFTETDILADSYIINKPIGSLLTYLRQGTYIHGDLINASQTVTISFPDLGTAAYKIIGNLVSVGSAGADSRINFVTREHTSTSFKLVMNDASNAGGQNVKFTYILTPDITN